MANVRRITKVIGRGRTFHIVWNDQFSRYCAIEDKYLDENGCLTKTLNGITMHASETVDQCIQGVQMEIEANYLLTQGYDMLGAMEVISFRIANAQAIIQ